MKIGRLTITWENKTQNKYILTGRDMETLKQLSAKYSAVILMPGQKINVEMTNGDLGVVASPVSPKSNFKQPTG
jgi:hypothetical protein